MRKTIYSIRRTEFREKEISSSDIVTGLASYEAAYRRLCREATSFGGKVEKDEKGRDVINLSDGKTNILYRIYGSNGPLGSTAQTFFQ